MAITYTWEVTSLKTKTVASTADVIVQTYWKKIGTDADGNVGTFSGATPFPTETIGASFTTFASLTEAQVLGWIQAKVTGDYEVHVNAQIQKGLDESTAPVSESEMPWFPVAEPAPE